MYPAILTFLPLHVPLSEKKKLTFFLFLFLYSTLPSSSLARTHTHAHFPPSFYPLFLRISFPFRISIHSVLYESSWIKIYNVRLNFKTFKNWKT